MAKVPFSKLNCKINAETIPIQIGEENINIKKYLPVQEKLALIGRVLEQAHDQDQNFANPLKIEVFKYLEIIYSYTDISFTAKQKEDPAKLYDQLRSSGVLTCIWINIPNDEKDCIDFGIKETIEAYYKYRNSAVGILDTISENYEQFNIDWDSLNEKVQNPETLKLVKSVLSKLD